MTTHWMTLTKIDYQKIIKHIDKKKGHQSADKLRYFSSQATSDIPQEQKMITIQRTKQ